MKSAGQWLGEYAHTHRNPTNKAIHKVCVPVIYWSVLAMLWMIPRLETMNGFYNWGTLTLVFVLGFYLRLGVTFFIEMLLLSIISLITMMAMEKANWPVFTIALVAFVIAWAGQFYGHKLEGRKPAFLQDLLFLLIGPIWLINDLKKSPPRPPLAGPDRVEPFSRRFDEPTEAHVEKRDLK